jgi:hypothetical protein
MREEVYTDEGMYDVGHHEPPREIPTYTQIETRRQSSVAVDSSAVSFTEVIVDSFPASRNDPAGVNAEVGTLSDQELLFTNSIRNEEAACHCRADMCRR